jgi:hypothetical protein
MDAALKLRGGYGGVGWGDGTAAKGEDAEKKKRGAGQLSKGRLGSSLRSHYASKKTRARLHEGSASESISSLEIWRVFVVGLQREGHRRSRRPLRYALGAF